MYHVSSNSDTNNFSKKKKNFTESYRAVLAIAFEASTMDEKMSQEYKVGQLSNMPGRAFSLALAPLMQCFR